MTRWLVVGGGSAGSVVAARLSEVEANEVVLLESGPDHGESADPPGRPVLERPRLLRSGTTVVRRDGAAAESYAQGFGLGGSSLVNGGVVVGSVAEWSSGHDLPVELATDLGPIASALVADPSSGAARVSFVQRAGRRVSAADAYLRGAERDNLVIRTNVSVHSLTFDRRRFVGVRTHGGEQFAADRVVLCAGAIGTPEILLRSGVDTPGVGAGLQDHLGMVLSFDLLRPDAGGAQIGATVERDGRQIVVMDHLPDRPDMGALIAGLLRVGSVGRVSLPEPDGLPLVELAQLSHPDDLPGLAQVVREAVELVRARSVSGLVGTVYADAEGRLLDEVITDDDTLHRWIGDHVGGYFHVAGSCREGVALDLDGALLGYEGVLVADASALPGVPARNPYLTVVRHAEVVAGRLVATTG